MSPVPDRHRPPITVTGKWGQEEVRSSGPQELLKCVFIGSVAQERPQWGTRLTYEAALEVGGSGPRDETPPALASLWGPRGSGYSRYRRVFGARGMTSDAGSAVWLLNRPGPRFSRLLRGSYRKGRKEQSWPSVRSSPDSTTNLYHPCACSSRHPHSTLVIPRNKVKAQRSDEACPQLQRT